MAFLSLIAKLGLDASGFETGLKRSESAVTKFSKQANSAIKSQIAGAIGVGAMVAASKAAIDYAGKITDVSQRIGVGVERLQEWDYAAKQTGATLDDFAGVARKIALARQDALSDPAGDAAKGFDKLNVSAQELRSLKIEDVIGKIGVAFHDAKNPQDLLAAGFATMGRGALPVIGTMREGLSQLGEDARSSFAVMADETISKLDDIGDAFTKLKASMIGGIGEGLVKMMSGVQNVWRFVKGTTANAAAYLGARSGGATRTAAADVGWQAQLDSAAQDATQDMARKAAAKKKREAFDFQTMDTTVADVKKQPVGGIKGYQAGQGNALQQIGAYSGVDPILRVSEKQVMILTQINQSTKQTAANTRATSSKEENFG